MPDIEFAPVTVFVGDSGTGKSTLVEALAAAAGFNATLDDEVDGQGRPVGVAGMFPDLHHRSHGESFLTLIDSKMRADGMYLLDEPESALSFHGQSKLLATMHDACAEGAQFLVATHSPMLMAYPGARIYELDDHGAHEVSFDEASSVGLWRAFLERPDRFFRHLFHESAD